MRSFMIFIRCQVILLLVCIGCARAPVERADSTLQSNLQPKAAEAMDDPSSADETPEPIALAEAANSQEEMSEDAAAKETVSMKDYDEPYSHKMAALELRWAELKSEFKTIREAAALRE